MTKTIRVTWTYYPIEPGEYTDIEFDDDATDEEIEQAAKETALEHFEWSWWKITKEHKNGDIS